MESAMHNMVYVTHIVLTVSFLGAYLALESIFRWAFKKLYRLLFNSPKTNKEKILENLI